MGMRNAVVELVDDDDDFLSQVAAAEVEALSAKRRKITPTATNSSEADTVREELNEGAYTAALRGSKSVQFRQQNSRSSDLFKVAVAGGSAIASAGFGGGGGGGSGGSGGSCFKCGKTGHWARDCDGNSSVADASVPEKACPCGLGTCLVLTANTDKNRGRKFYKCPVRQENGGCGFFEWCENQLGSDMPKSTAQSCAWSSAIPDLACPCGAGTCLIHMAKTGKNIGQRFYRCPSNQGSSCGFFKWCAVHTMEDGIAASVNTSRVHTVSEMSNKSYGVKSGSSCFKCGKDGHWAKDCMLSPVQNPVNIREDPASSGTCFKCGKLGHWAKDCSYWEHGGVQLKH